MEQILEHVLPENKEWASQLSGKNIADILNTFALIPSIKSNFVEHETPKEDAKEDTKEDAKETAKSKDLIPAIKGLVGENNFYNIISQYSEYEIINVAKQGKAGDFMIKWQSYKTNKIYKILVDVKNYSKAVPTIEIDKFYRDINLNDIDGGLLLSFNSKITGINKIIEIKDIITDNKVLPVMFAQSNTPLLIMEVLKLLLHHIEIKDISKGSLCKSAELIYRINSLGDSIQTFKDCNNMLQLSKNEIEKSLNNIMLKIMACEFELINKISNINSVLVGIDNEQKNNIVKTVMATFGSYILDDTGTYLNSIYECVKWVDNLIIEPRKIWRLLKDDKYIDIKFQKSGLIAIFNKTNDEMSSITDKTLLKKLSANSIGVKVNSSTISHVNELCKNL